MNPKWLHSLQQLSIVHLLLNYLKKANAFSEEHENLSDLPYEVWRTRFLKARLNFAFGLVSIGYFIRIIVNLLQLIHQGNYFLSRYVLLDSLSLFSLLICFCFLQTTVSRRHLILIFLGFSWSLEMNEQVVETVMAIFNPTLAEFIQPERLAWVSTFFSQAILIPVYWPLHVLSQCIVLGYYFSINRLYGFDTIPDTKEPIGWFLTLLWVCLVCDISVYLYERLQRTEFRSRQQLNIAYQELEIAEQEIRQALLREKEVNQLKSRLVSMISHEFRTPLTTILGSTEALEHYSYKWSEEKKAVYFRRIQTTIQHLNDLINDILIYGKAEANRLSFNPQLIQLEEFCMTLIEEMKASDQNQHKIQFIVKNQLNQSIMMDEKLLRHIFSNLLSNAIKYSPAGTLIIFKLEYHQNQVTFTLADLGVGIAEEDMKHLFESFYRAQNVGTIPGTGLGLAIAKRAVDVHQGSITVQSQIGEGTIFTVTLPFNNSGVKSND
ncbi:MAG: HAMP domain-containing sensor histidine kinase [Microcoleaceae cyanobacterium]